MDEEKLPRQLLCGQLYRGTRPPGGQRKRYKDHCKNILKQCNVNPAALETLTADRVLWRYNTKQCRHTIMGLKSIKRAKNRTKRLERALGRTINGPHHICDICGKVCMSHIGLHSHVRWHQRNGTTFNIAIVILPA